jgi:hypothetical protein
MNTESRLVFDDIVEDNVGTAGTVTAYSKVEHDAFLADSQQLALHVISDASVLVTVLNVQIELSGDGRNWQNNQMSPEYQAGRVPVGIQQGWVGEAWPTSPNLKHARLRIDASNAGSPFSTYVKIYVASRSRRSQARASGPAAAPSLSSATARGQGAAPLMSRATLDEIRALYHHERTTGPGAHERVVARLSASARQEVSRVLRPNGRGRACDCTPPQARAACCGDVERR